MSASDSRPLRVATDIVYTPEGDGVIEQKLDIHYAADPAAPVLVYLHGGGWRAGDKSQPRMPQTLAAQGITVVNANYTLVGDRPYPQNLEDVFQVVQFLSEHGTELELNTSRLFLGGASSGGHLASLAVTKGTAEQRLALPIAGVVSWFAPVDPASRFLRHRYPAEQRKDGFWDRGLAKGEHGNDPFRPFIGTTDFTQVTLAQALDADPRFHLDRLDPQTLPPFLLLVGDHDSEEIQSSQRILFQALSWVGADAEFLVVTGADHEDRRYEKPAAVGAVVGFVRAASATP